MGVARPCGVLAVATLATIPASGRTMSFEERVDHAIRLERILDQQRGGVAGSFASRVPRDHIARRVERDLARSALVEAAGSRITAALLQAEMDRAAASSRDRETLAALHRALSGDPYLIAECLARPVVAAKLFFDRFGGDEALRETPLPAGWREPWIDAEELSPPGARSAMLCATGGFPGARAQATAVYTGTEVLIWGGRDQYYPPSFADQGLRYDLAHDRWSPMSPGPTGRTGHAAAWSGSRLYVWGGCCVGNDGHAYDPRTDSWEVLPASGLAAREEHTAVWTGSELIVWGGRWESRFNATFYRDGARYDPATRMWRPTSIAAATPTHRAHHGAVFTGSEMLVWGGGNDFHYWPTGARYDPQGDVWTTMGAAGAPTPSGNVVWTGAEMLVWDGDIGGGYDPVADVWRTLSPSPTSGDWASPLVWNGQEAMAWGCFGACTGLAYDPVADTWTSLAGGPDEPSYRGGHSMTWAGSELFVWGGDEGSYLATGGRYDPAAARWRPTSVGTWVPPGRDRPGLVWTGAEVLIFGGNDQGACAGGGRYLPSLDAWLPMTTEGDWPGPMNEHATVWTGSRMMVWGGTNRYPMPRESALYDPATDSWRAVTASLAPPWARSPAFVWTGSEVLVWGGYTSPAPEQGGRYDPATDTWRPITTQGEPAWRQAATAVWTGTEMVVWGGTSGDSSGGRYDPVADVWRPTSTGAGVPSPRVLHTMVWTGSVAVVWGGQASSPATILGDGGMYDPVGDAWQPLPWTGAFPRRRDHSAVWSGTEMLVWGGHSETTALGGGVALDPVAGTWRIISSVQAPSARYDHGAVFAGGAMMVWGGHSSLGDGGAYDPVLDSWSCDLGVSGAELLVGKTSSLGSPGQAMHVYQANGVLVAAVPDAFPTLLGGGVRVSAGDVDPGGSAEMLAAPGPNALHPPNVRGFDAQGTPIAGLDFLAYGVSGYGANVGSGAIDAAERVLTGPGASPVYGPHVRGFGFTAGAVVPVAKASFFAYGTLRYGVNPSSGDLDADGLAEIATGPGPGIPFGPHIRGFNYDGISIQAMGAVSFYAFGSLHYGTEIGTGDVEGDGFAEILAGPGPSATFAPHLRGFDVDGGTPRPRPGINAVVFPGAAYGLNVTAGDLDADGLDEVACGAGPDPAMGSRLAAFRAGGSGLVPLPTLSFDAFGASRGVRLGAADLE